MAYLNANIPIIECYVRGNYLRDQRDSHDTTHTHNTEHSHDTTHEHDNTETLINGKEIEILKLDIQELKETIKNPLAN